MNDSAGTSGRTGRRATIWAPDVRPATIGALALVALGAFETLALTTVMPVIAKDLRGEAWYAMAFTATLAAGIVSIVLAGNLADRSGPRKPLQIGLVLFAAGLVGAALAPTMAWLIVARVLQGLGAGMTTTALYVLVTRVYSRRLHPAVFAGFAAAWMVPSIVGPFIAGAIAQAFGWRWVFGISLIVLVNAAVLLRRVLRTVDDEAANVPWRWRALAAAVLVAVTVLVLNALSERAHGWWLAAVPAVLLVLLAGIRMLTPSGLLRMAAGLPAAIGLRALGFASFAGAEIYIPRLLTERDQYPPTLAGLALSITGITWFLGSWVQGRFSDRIDLVLAARVGMALAVSGLVGLAIAAWVDAPPGVLIALWPLVGLGLGTVFPRSTTQALALADRGQSGFVSSALQLGDNTGAAGMLAVSAIVFTLAAGLPGWGNYAAVFAVAALPALIGLLFAHRARSVD